MDNIRYNKKIYLWGVTTLALLYLLILIGGIVRATGSGMGCPDWPKCFGKWVPPTKIEELPENYKEIYSEKRRLKNLKIAKMFQYLNMNEISNTLVNNKSMYEEASFNATKTWIEYINRLFGVLVGISVLLFSYHCLLYYKTDILISLLGISSLILVLFQGWLGSIVVSTNLLPFTITLHMFLAMILVVLVLLVLFRANFYLVKNNTSSFSASDSALNKFQLLSIFLLILTLSQILLGTTVREQIDIIAIQFNHTHRFAWIEALDYRFYIHRSYSILILVSNLFFLNKIYQNRATVTNSVQYLSYLVLFLLASEIFVGIVMSYFSIPAFFQPIHLTFGCMLFGTQLYLHLSLFYSKSQLVNNI